MPPRPMDAAKLWAKENLENVDGAKLWKHEMCGWNNKGRANLKLKAEYGGIERVADAVDCCEAAVAVCGEDTREQS